MYKQFNIVKKGYDIDEVDSYVRELEQTIQNYKDKDSSIKNAIISAQVAADNILRNANIEAEEIKQDVFNELNYLVSTVKYQKNFIKEFQNDYNVMVLKYIRHFNEIDIQRIIKKIDEFEEKIFKIQNTKVDNNQESIDEFDFKENTYDFEAEIDSN